MHSLTLDEIAPLFDGHVDLRRRAKAVQAIRLPVAELNFYDPFTRWVASCAAGVRLRFTSTTQALTLTATQRMTGGDRRGDYDLYVDGALHARGAGTGGAVLDLDSGGLVGDEAFSIAFQDLPPGDKLIELWLPQTATVSVTGLTVDDDAAVAPAPDTRPRILFHGSSITHCMEAQGASAGWPAVAANLAGVSHQNLGWGGSCLLSSLAARIIRDARADAIVLKLGINVWPEGMLKRRTFLDSAHAMISIIRERHAETPILIVSPIFSPGREDDGEGLPLRQMRSLLEEVVAARVAAGDSHIRYLSGLSLFSEADAHLLPDDLHPNTEGYRLMGERFHAQMLAGETPLLRL